MAQHLEIDRQHRELLADIVVQFARKPGVLLFLGREQSPAEVANAIVARTKLFLARTQPLLGLTASVSLKEQARDQRRLRQHQRRRADDVASVAIPDREIAIPHERSRGDASFVDAPPLELTPVELRDAQIRL